MPVPGVVDESRLKEGKLLNDEQKRKAQDYFSSHPNAVLYAGEEELPYPVALSKEGKIFVLYATPKQLHYTSAETSKIPFQDDSQTTTPRPLGGGASAIVVAAQSLEDDSWSAAKFQTTTRAEEAVRQEIAREQRVLGMMNLFKGSATIERVETILDRNSITTMTVMELAIGKKLENLIEEEKRKPIDQKLQLVQVLNIMFQLSKKTDDLAKKGFVQCDFNPKNVMCHIRSLTDLEIRLVDFGEVYQLNEKGEFIPRERIPDTPGYGAPEIVRGGYLTSKGCYSENTMAFSLGKTLGALLGVSAETSTTNIIEKTLREVVYKLSHEDPNQRINAELAAEEIKIINDYHELLKKSGMIDSHKELTSLREHMHKTRDSKTDSWQFNAELRRLEERLIECQHKQFVYQCNILEKRMSSYINSIKAKEPKPKSHIRDMKELQKKIQKLDQNQENFSAKIASLRAEAYQKQIQFESKVKEKQSKESSKVADRMPEWFRSILPSLPRNASVSRDSGEIPRSASAAAVSVSGSLSQTPSTTSIASTTVISTTSSTALNVDDTSFFRLSSASPPPVILSRSGSGRSSSTQSSQSPQRNGKSPSSPPSKENKTFSAGFSPAFKLELERRLTELNSKGPVAEEKSVKTSHKSPSSTRGGSG